MRKLLHIGFGVIKNNTQFNPNLVLETASEPTSLTNEWIYPIYLFDIGINTLKS